MNYSLRSLRLVVAAISLTSVPFIGCSAGSSGNTGTGGRSGSSGGASATGGYLGTGGANSTGGETGSGGVVGTGGATGSGGVTATGGVSSTGGTSTGGGAPADGGVPGTGGAGAPDGGGTAAVTANPSRFAISGGRDVTSPATQTLQLRNTGTSAVQVTALMLTGTNQSLFHVTSPAQLPAMITPGGNLPLTLQTETKTGLPAQTDAVARMTGVTFLTATLTAVLGSSSLQIPVYGLVALTLVSPSLEPTFGQILTALGYMMKVGKAQNNWNWNNGNPPTSLGGVEAGTDEVAAQLFVKVGTGDVTMVPVARFSPEGTEQFGWYRPGMSTMRNTVGMMMMVSNAQTSNGARTIYPPTSGATTFDPGTMPFGLYASTSPGDATAVQTHGTMVFSQDSLNTPANVHRVKAFTLKDGTGMVVPNSYLLGFEEAGNGDYQDYVFMLTNVKPSP